MSKPDAFEVLKVLEFAGQHGKCPLCFGWDCGPNGETPGKHTKDCMLNKCLSVGRSTPSEIPKQSTPK